MIKELVSTENMPYEEWLKCRQKGIGGSDASVVCGINQYKSLIQLWLEKTGQLEPTSAGEAAYWGTVLEPIVKKEFTKQTGMEVIEKKAIYQHPTHTYMLANVDGIVEDPIKGQCIFEAKTASAYIASDWEHGVPDYYQLQVQHYMAVMNVQGAYVSVLLGGNQFKWYFVERDDEIIDLLIRLEKNFWQNVINEVPPSLDGTAASTEFLNRLYPSSTPKTAIELPKEAVELLNDYDTWSEKLKEASEQKDLASNRLKELLGCNETAKIHDRIVSWKSVKSSKLDTERLKKEQPELYKKFLIQFSYRRFSVK